MAELLSLIARPDFWFTTVICGVLVNLLSHILLRKFPSISVRISSGHNFVVAIMAVHATAIALAEAFSLAVTIASHHQALKLEQYFRMGVEAIAWSSAGLTPAMFVVMTRSLTVQILYIGAIFLFWTFIGSYTFFEWSTLDVRGLVAALGMMNGLMVCCLALCAFIGAMITALWLGIFLFLKDVANSHATNGCDISNASSSQKDQTAKA